ncbi:hypothetical protein [Enterococcus avium]|uniref:hypothetical protein n=1 Tax=Enterococcus avium TaxID=33945 RepID=UPI003D6A28E6
MKKGKPFIFLVCCLMLLEQTVVSVCAVDMIPNSEPVQTSSESSKSESFKEEKEIEKSTEETGNSVVEDNTEGSLDTVPEFKNSNEIESVPEESSVKEMKVMSSAESMLSLEIENEQQFKAVLLGEVYEESEQTAIDYGTIDDSEEIVLLLKTSLNLSEAIRGIKRENLKIVGNGTDTQIMTSNSNCQLSFENQSSTQNQLVFQSIEFSNVISTQDFIHTDGAFELRFIDSSFFIGAATAAIHLNNQARVFFSGETSISTYSGTVRNLILASEINIDDHFLAEIQGSGNASVFTANKVCITSDSISTFSKTNTANQGAAFELTDSLSSLVISDKATVEVNQTGRLALVNSNTDSSFSLGKEAILHLTNRQGLTGNGNSYFDSVIVGAGSQLEINNVENGFSSIRARRSFVVEDSSEQKPTQLNGRRGNTASSAFIQMDQQNAEITIGDYTQIAVEQLGPMITGTSGTTIDIRNHVMIDNEHSFGLTGSVAVESIEIGDSCSINLTEPANAATSTAYSTFLAQKTISIGQNTTIDFKQTRTTATNALFCLSATDGQLNIGAASTINAETRGAILQASLATVTLNDYSKVIGTVGQGFTGGTVVKKIDMKDSSEIILTEHNNNTNTVMFSIEESFTMGPHTILNVHRNSTRDASLITFSGKDAYFQSFEECQITVNQVGAVFEGLRTTKLLFGNKNVVNITSSRGLTGSVGTVADSIKSLDIGEDTKVTLIEHPSVNVAQVFIRLRDSLTIGERSELAITRESTRTTSVIRLTRSNSKFTMQPNSKLKVKAAGATLNGKSSTDMFIGDDTEVSIESGYGLTSNFSIRSLIIGKRSTIKMKEPTSGNVPSTSLNVPAIRVAKQFTLGEESVLESTRERTTSDSRFMRLNSANSEVKLEKNAVMKINQSGGIFNPVATSRFILEEGATFDAVTKYGLTQSSRRFKELTIQKKAAFSITDEDSGVGSGSSFTGRPLIDIGDQIHVDEDAVFRAKTTINRSEIIYFRNTSAVLAVSNAKYFELSHPTLQNGSGNTRLQRLIRSASNTTSKGLKISIEDQKLSLWTSQQELPNEEFINISGSLRINRNNGVRPNFALSASGRSRFIHGESISGAMQSKNGEDVYETIAKNNFHRLILSTPEGLVAGIDPLSDQSESITGYMYEDSDIIDLRYTDLAGKEHQVMKDSPEIIWGEYRDEEEQYRYFTVPLGERRLATDSEVTIFLSKPTSETFIDITSSEKVIKGIDYQGFNATVSKDKINSFTNDDDLYQYLLNETRVSAQNILTQEDLTAKAKIIETNLTRSVKEDGTYYAVIEVGNKPYQFPLAIEVTSNLHQMNIVIPMKMIFESLYSANNMSRDFTSKDYQIRNQSLIVVDTYVNEFAVKQDSGVVLLREGEDPLDYAESDSEEEDPVLTEEDIKSPLLKLFLKTEEGETQLYNRMTEKHVATMDKRTTKTIGLSGHFYGDYPKWIVDSEEEAGGYYEENLVPKYNLIFRFVPNEE